MNSTRTLVFRAAAALLLVSPGAALFAAETAAPKPAAAPVEWVKIPGGSFRMGQDNRDEGPVHFVKVEPFELAKSEVTIGQYRACVEAGVCSPVDAECMARSTLPTSDEYPVYCVDWDQARIYSEWVGGRLPSEAEWEYAARGAGRKQTYPWGDERPTCERAVFSGMDCGRPTLFPVCSKPKGNTPQGLCDMGGNVTEWVADRYHISYRGAPSDGRAWDSPEYLLRGARGGAWFEKVEYLYVAKRGFSGERNQCLAIGVRPVKDVGVSGGAGDVVWVKIPGGTYTVRGVGGPDSGKVASVKPFLISKNEITFKQYHDCVKAGACVREDVNCASVEPELRLMNDDRPVLCVDWFQAKQYARWVGGRLPTDVEWEYAARSAGKDRNFPWGDSEPTCEQAAFNGKGCGEMSSRPVCASPRGNTDQGVCDMSGNVGEWVEDLYLDPAEAKARSDAASGRTVRPHRGGSWYDGNDALRAASRDMADQRTRGDDMGFRPARSPRD